MVMEQSKSMAAQGDIRGMLSLLLSGVNLTEEEFIEKSIGNLRFLYYLFLDKLHTRPCDMEDLIDGLLYLDSVSYVSEQEIARQRRVNQSK